MNKIQQLTRIMLIGIGIFIVIRIIPESIMTLQILIFSLFSQTENKFEFITMSLLPLAGTCLMLWAVIYCLFIKSRDIALKISHDCESEEQTSDLNWLVIAYRLVCIGTGLFFLYRTIWQTISVLTRLSLYTQYSGQQPISITQLAGLVLSLAVGIYLTTGAHHFVQWHVRKTQQILDSTSQNTSTSSSKV